MFIYCADVYCNKCGEAIKARILEETGDDPEKFSDESDYDSDEFPKGPYSDNQESNTPQHCASGAECLDPVEIGGENYGYFFENDLTSDGIKYLREAITEGGEVAEFWYRHYSQFYDDLKPSEDSEGE